MLNVGVWGAAGFMGAPFSVALIRAHRASHLRFIILHRPESDLARYPSDIEKRCIDLSSDRDVVAAQLNDLEVVISCASSRVTGAQCPLIDALAGSEKLVTFFPSEYATPHREEDMTGSMLGHSREKRKVAKYCEDKGVPYTRLYNATVPSLLFRFGPNPTFQPAENKLQLYWPLGDGKRGLTSEDFSGQALVYLLLNRLDDLPNRTLSLVEVPFSAQDLIDVFSKLHDGQEPTTIKYTEEDYQRDIHGDMLTAMGASSKKGLAIGTQWPGEVVSTFPGWEQRTLEDYVRPALTLPPLGFAELRQGIDLSQV